MSFQAKSSSSVMTEENQIKQTGLEDANATTLVSNLQFTRQKIPTASIYNRQIEYLCFTAFPSEEPSQSQPSLFALPLSVGHTKLQATSNFPLVELETFSCLCFLSAREMKLEIQSQSPFQVPRLTVGHS